MNITTKSIKDKYLFVNIKIIFNFIMAIYPILSIYTAPVITVLELHEFIIIFFVLIFLIEKKGNCIIQKSGYAFLLFSVYSMILSVIMSFFIKDATGRDMIFRMLRNLMQVALILWVGRELFDFRLFFKFYKRMGVLSSVFLVIQYVAFMGFGRIIYWLVPGMKLNYSIVDETAYYNHYITSFYHFGSDVRVTGGFTEPTSYAAFVLPLLALLLIEEEQNRSKGLTLQKILDRITIVIITCALFISTSATGIICTFIVYAIFFFKYVSRKNKKMLVWFSLCFALIVGILLYQIFNDPIFHELASRLSELSLKKGPTSGNQRIIRGFAVWKALPFLMKIFGTGFGNISDCLTSYRISTPYDPAFGSSYMNAVAEVMVSTGLVGMVLFIYAVWKWCIGKWKFFLEFIAIFLILMISLNMLSSVEFVTMVLVLANYKYERV